MNETIQKMQENIVPVQYSIYIPCEEGKGIRILFVGNSITRHRPKPDIGWTRNCGMEASCLEKDYVHLLMSKIREVDPEAAYAIQVTRTLEREFEELDLTSFDEAKAFNADIVIFFFGANVRKDYAQCTDLRQSFADACVQARRYVSDHARCFWFEGFYIRPEIDAEKKKAAEICGDRYCSLGEIPYREDYHGSFNHPNDEGMAAIAERMWEVLRTEITKA